MHLVFIAFYLNLPMRFSRAISNIGRNFESMLDLGLLRRLGQWPRLMHVAMARRLLHILAIRLQQLDIAFVEGSLVDSSFALPTGFDSVGGADSSRVVSHEAAAVVGRVRANGGGERRLSKRSERLMAERYGRLEAARGDRRVLRLGVGAELTLRHRVGELLMLLADGGDVSRILETLLELSTEPLVSAFVLPRAFVGIVMARIAALGKRSCFL